MGLKMIHPSMWLEVEWQEFTKFLNRGNLAEMCIGLSVGGAFNAIASALTNDMLYPALDIFIPKRLSRHHFIVIRPGRSGAKSYQSRSAAEEDGAVSISFGSVLQAVISFLVQATLIFLIVRLLSKTKHLPGLAGRVGQRLNNALPTDRA